MATTNPAPAYLETAWVIGDGDYCDLVCEYDARQFAARRGLVWANSGYTEESDAGYAYAIVFSSELETDYPQACAYCDTYLDGALTRDGEQYLRERYPASWWHLWGVSND